MPRDLPRAACGRCAATGAEVVEGRGHAAAPGRLRAAARARRRGCARQPDHRDWHGRLRPGDARARRALRLGVDLRRRAARHRTGDARDACSTSTASARSSDTTAIYGIVGGSVAHSVSPAMHNAAFRGRAASTRCICRCPRSTPTISSRSAARSGSAARASRFRTRSRCSTRVDEVDAVARRIGAINTIRVVDGRWIGGNTDAAGFLAAAARSRGADGRRAAVLGAGGAARAVAVALASSGCARARARARQRAQAEEVAALVVGRAWDRGRREPGSWDLLVNCTPIGMYPHVDETPLPAERADAGVCLRPGLQPAGRRGCCARRRPRLPDDRRPRHARRAGAGAVSVVDRRAAAGRRDARGRAQAAGGVHAR